MIDQTTTRGATTWAINGDQGIYGQLKYNRVLIMDFSQLCSHQENRSNSLKSLDVVIPLWGRGREWYFCLNNSTPTTYIRADKSNIFKYLRRKKH